MRKKPASVPRMTTFSYGTASIPIDVDQHWNEFLNSDTDTQLETVSNDDTFWLIQLPWMDSPDEAKTVFWNAFATQTADRCREVAVRGAEYANKRQLLHLLQMAHRVSQMTGKRRMELAAVLGCQFADIVAEQDPKIFRRMTELVENNGIPEVGGDTRNSKILRSFTDFVKTNRSLPTKSAIRKAVGGDEKKFSAALKELGLSGLPQGKRLPKS